MSAAAGIGLPQLWLLGLAAFVLLHAVVVAIFAAAMGTPNPFKRLTRRRHPSNFGVHAESFPLGGGEPAWFLVHATSPRLVIVLHGRSRSKAWMLPAIAALHGTANVLAFDFPGHGDLPWRPTSLGRREAASVHRAIDWAEAQGFRDIVLYGTSMGGAAALFALGERPRASVTSVVTDGTFDRLGRVVDGVADRLHVPGYVRRIAESVLKRVGRLDVRRTNPIEQAAALNVPALFLHGDNDPLVPTDSAERLAAAAPNGRCLVYPGRHDEPQNQAMQEALLRWVVEPWQETPPRILPGSTAGTPPATLQR